MCSAKVQGHEWFCMILLFSFLPCLTSYHFFSWHLSWFVRRSSWRQCMACFARARGSQAEAGKCSDQQSLGRADNHRIISFQDLSRSFKCIWVNAQWEHELGEPWMYEGICKMGGIRPMGSWYVLIDPWFQYFQPLNVKLTSKAALLF
jgi:hypothetical protein